MLKSSLLLNAVRLLGGKDGNENSDGEAGRALCSGEEVDSDNRIRQWLLDCRPPTTESGPPVDTKQSSSAVGIKKLSKRHSIDCEASAYSYRRKFLTSTASPKTADDARQVFGRSLNSRSEITKTSQQHCLESSAGKERPRPSKSKAHNLDQHKSTVIYHPDFADWTSIEPATDTRDQSCDKPPSSSELLQVLDNATAAFSKLLSVPFKSSGEATMIRSN